MQPKEREMILKNNQMISSKQISIETEELMEAEKIN